MVSALCHISTSQYWAFSHNDPRCLREVSRARKILAQPLSSKAHGDIPYWIDRPLHLLCIDPSLRRRSKDCIYHVWSSAIPKGALLDTGKGFYVSSPEFYFIQMASTLSLVDLMMLGFELCGSYRISKGELHPRPALTTVAHLRSFVSQIGTAPGLKKASQALRYVLDNSASPMESSLALLLVLPYRLGGYGITPPTMNYPIGIVLSGTFSHSYVCDLFWPHVKLAVEYDSNKHHAGKEKMTYDSIRRSDLTTQGVLVISVTNSQLKSFSETDKLARFFAKQTGKTIRYNPHDFRKANLNLRKELFSHHRFPLPPEIFL